MIRTINDNALFEAFVLIGLAHPPPLIYFILVTWGADRRLSPTPMNGRREAQALILDPGHDADFCTCARITLERARIGETAPTVSPKACIRPWTVSESTSYPNQERWLLTARSHGGMGKNSETR